MSQNPPPAFDLEPLVSVDGHRRLWAEALALLIRDAQAFWTGSASRGAEAFELEQAFDDLCRCGPMTRYCCKWLDCEPMVVSLAFVRWCEGLQEQDAA